MSGIKRGYAFKKYSWVGLLFMPLTSVCAGNLTIEVASEGLSSRVGEASVCIGTSEQPTLYGSRLTNREGKAAFADVPNGKLAITVSKEGYRSHSRSVTKGQHSSSIYVPLKQGSGGPVCVAAKVRYDSIGVKKKTQSSYSLQLGSMKINNNAPASRSHTVTLNNRANGSPTHYRASEKNDFSDAKWLPYSPAPEFNLSDGSGLKTVHFQLRKTIKLGAGEITRDSVVMSDVIRTYK